MSETPWNITLITTDCVIQIAQLFKTGLTGQLFIVLAHESPAKNTYVLVSEYKIECFDLIGFNFTKQNLYSSIFRCSA